MPSDLLCCILFGTFTWILLKRCAERSTIRTCKIDSLRDWHQIPIQRTKILPISNIFDIIGGKNAYFGETDEIKITLHEQWLQNKRNEMKQSEKQFKRRI